MKRTLRPLILLAAGVAAAASGCTDNDESMQIVGFSIIMPGTTGCTAMVQTTMTVNYGIYDVGVQNTVGLGYMFAPIIQNNLVATSNGSTIERNNINVMGLEVELHPSGGGNFPTVDGVNLSASYKSPSAIGLATPIGGRVAAIVEAFSQTTASRLGKLMGNTNWDGNLVVHARAYGQHAGGDITSGWVDFPVKVCKGCLTGGDIGRCPPGGVSGTIQMGGCYPGQDLALTCCTDDNSRTLCGSNVPVKAAGTGDGGI
jgi:hypothetical protein